MRWISDDMRSIGRFWWDGMTRPVAFIRQMIVAKRLDEQNTAAFRAMARFWTGRARNTSALNPKLDWEWEEERWREQSR
jgi:hypothetical protein